MSAFAPALASSYDASTTELESPFPREVETVFDSLERLLTPRGEEGRPQPPSDELVNWAKEVLLRVIPSAYLIGAEVNAFETEIHVVWENEGNGKKVIVFFPRPRELKIYHELLQQQVVVDHSIIGTGGANDVSDRLRWFFAE